jgi:hypothetical protein
MFALVAVGFVLLDRKTGYHSLQGGAMKPTPVTDTRRSPTIRVRITDWSRLA